MVHMARANRTRFAVLGALSIGPRSGYDVKRDLESTVGYFWKESFGQIYPILRGLVDAGFATVEEDAHGGRARRVYSITPAGRQEFAAWLAVPPEPPQLRNELLLKLFFCRQVDPSVAIGHLRAAAARAQAVLQALAAIHEEVESERDENPDYDYFQITVRSGQLNNEALLKWCNESIERLERRAQRDSAD